MDPLTILVISVILSLVISAFCSLMEATLYAVPVSFVHSLKEQGNRAGEILARFKSEMGKPISAILILNTISNTGGAAIAGWAAGEIISSKLLVVAFTVSFILAILYLSEIIPKIIGVNYSRPVAVVIARPLQFIVTALTPLIALSHGISRRLQTASASHGGGMSIDEVLSMAAIGTEEGALDHFEGSVIANVIGLDRLLVRDLLTPRVVVFRLPEDTKLGELRSDIGNWNFSRVPVYNRENPEHLSHYVTQRDIYRELLQGHDDKLMRDLARPLKAVPDLMRADRLLLDFFADKEHLRAVVDEHGGLAGIVSLEDVIEEVVGQEIVDEYDSVSDMRTLARLMRMMKGRKRDE
jgi:CBS domain containing-hemolysin-like protein